jgi:hypothetical protein
MLHAHKVVSAKTNMFCAVCKKTNFGYKKCRFYVKRYVRT